MKLNIGSNDKRVKGYLNIDGLDSPNVDAVGELGLAPYIFTVKDPAIWGDLIQPYTLPEGSFVFRQNAFEEVLAVEFLEHISFKNTLEVLGEWHRILAPGGVVKIQVPDCGLMMDYYVNGQICECVPHKSQAGNSEGAFAADPNCFSCQGKGKIHPNRWLYAFTGAQKHQYDAHLNVFTQERMAGFLTMAGFKDIAFTEDLYKIKVTATK